MAQGGWDRYAAEPVRECYALKRAATASEWKEASLSKALADALEEASGQEGGRRKDEAVAAALALAAGRAIASAEAQLRNEDWRRDPKALRLLDIQAFPKAAQELRYAAKALAESDALLGLLNVEPPEWRRLKAFEEFSVAGVKIWIASPLAWISQGRACFFEPRAAAPEPGVAGLHAGVLDLFASCRFKTPSGSSLLTLALPSGDAIEIHPETRAALELAKDGARKIAERTGKDGLVRIGDFPKRAGKEKCATCRFKPLCEKTGDLNQGA